MVGNMHITGCFVKKIGVKIKVHNWFSEDHMPNMAYGWLVGSKGHIYVSTNKKVDNMHIMGCYVKMFGKS